MQDKTVQNGMSTIKKITINLSGLAVLAILVFGGYLLLKPQPSLIPEGIKKKISYTIFIPAPASSWQVDVTKTTYDANTGVLTTNLMYERNNITMTQQNVPQTFKDVPTYYPALLNKLHEYAEIQTSVGTVALTKPDELKGGQTAVATISNTLMFLHPDHSLTNQQWEQFFNNLENSK